MHSNFHSALLIVILNLFSAPLLIDSIDEFKCEPIHFGKDVNESEFKSPGFPLAYFSSLDCLYTIDGAVNKSIYLEFVSFETKQFYDKLEIYETYIVADNHYSARIATLSGDDLSDETVFESSIGNGFKALLVTDQEYHMGGFHAHFIRLEASLSDEVCTKFFHEATAEVRKLEPPSKLFTHRKGCSYLINATLGYRVRLEIKSMLPITILKIYETEALSYTGVGPPLAKLTKSSVKLPFTIKSKTRSIIVFMSRLGKKLQRSRDFSPYFELTYQHLEIPCKCFDKNIILKIGEETDLLSPGYPETHCDNLNCSITIQVQNEAQEEGLIRLDINKLLLEMDHNYIYLINRRNEFAEYLYKLTGNFDFDDTTTFTFSSSNCELAYVTTKIGVADGFNITARAIERIKDCKCPGETQLLNVSSASGSFSFDVPPTCRYLDCFIHIIKPPHMLDGSSRLCIHFDYMFKNADEEFLKVTEELSDYHDTDKFTYDRMRKINNTEKIYRMNSTSLWYHLAAVESNETASFNFTYEWKEGCKCGESNLVAEVDTWKTLTSPEYPEVYCNEMDCSYLISAPEGYIIVVNIEEFELEFGSDYLTIFNGPTVNDTCIKRATGMEIFELQIKGSKSQMLIQFTADAIIMEKGFVLRYSADPSPNAIPSSSYATTIGIFFLVILCAILASVLIISYKRKLYCFKNEFPSGNEPCVGFTNISYQSKPID